MKGTVMKSINKLWIEIVAHPDYVAGVLWIMDDIEADAENFGVDSIALAEKAMDVLGEWEDSATLNGNDLIGNAAAELQRLQQEES